MDYSHKIVQNEKKNKAARTQLKIWGASHLSLFALQMDYQCMQWQCMYMLLCDFISNLILIYNSSVCNELSTARSKN